jgi:membrane protein DedA with SNARE-associated domain
MPYRRFLFFTALGGVLWGITFCLVGYLAGNSYARIEQTIGRGVAVVMVLVVVLLLIGWHLRRPSDRSEQSP